MAIGSIFHIKQNAQGAVIPRDTACRFRGISGRQSMAPKYKQQQGPTTMDIVIIGIEVLFFAVSLAYIKICDAL